MIPVQGGNNIKIHYSFVLVVLLVVACKPVGANSFSPYQEEPWNESSDYYLDQANAPDIQIDREDDGEWKITNHEGTLLDTYARDDNLSSRTTTRYRDRSYLIVERIYSPDGEDTKTKTYLYDQDGLRVEEPNLGEYQSNSLTSLVITRDGNFGILTERGFLTWTPSGEVLSRVDAPVRLVEGKIQPDLDGDISLIGRSEDRTIYLSNGEEWFKSDLRITPHGDREEILSTYPLEDEGAAGAVYKYINAFNKGLYLLRTEGPGQPMKVNPIFLSANRNVGWNPDLFVDEDHYFVHATDSTNTERIRLTILRKRVRGDTTPEPETGQFMEGEKFVSFFGGVYGMNQYWNAKSRVQQDPMHENLFQELVDFTAPTNVLTEVDYNLDSTTLKGVQFQGRVGNTRLVMNYLEQLAADESRSSGGKAAEESVQQLFGMVEFQDFFSPSSGLRMNFNWSQTEGLASVKRRDRPDSEVEFSLDYSQFRLLNTRERGKYWGLEYTNYRLPSAVGFSNNKNTVVYSDFDPNFGLTNYLVVGGYDPQHYARRYETSYSDWFFSGEGGVGIGTADISSDLKAQAEAASGTETIETPLYFTLSTKFRTGYLWQWRSRSLRGAGYQFMAGYRWDGTFMTAGDEADDEDLNDKLELEFRRMDLIHGPFFRMSILF